MVSRTSVHSERPGAPSATSTGFAPAPSALLQRSCACGGGKSGGCDECGKKKLRRRAAGHDASHQTAPPVVGEVLSGAGRALDASTRAFMEPRFGHDFSKVRVHADERAADSARAVGALAYTVGDRIVFGAGQYRPGTSEGQRLLAHELTHVTQGARAGDAPRRATSLEVSHPSDPLEVEADETAARVVSGASVAAGPSHASSAGVAARQVPDGSKLYRDPAPEEEEAPATEAPPVVAPTAQTTEVSPGEGEPEEMQGRGRPRCTGAISVPSTPPATPPTPGFNFGIRFRFPTNENQFFCLNQMSLRARFQNTGWNGPTGNPTTYLMTLVREGQGGREIVMADRTNTVGGNETQNFPDIGRGGYAIRLEYHPRVNTRITGSIELT